MGTDIRFTVEHKARWGDNSEHWEMVGLHYPCRNSKFFEKLNRKGNMGLPVDADRDSKEILNEECLFGHGWMMMEEFYKIKNAEYMLPQVWKKKEYPNLRVLWSYDN